MLFKPHLYPYHKHFKEGFHSGSAANLTSMFCVHLQDKIKIILSSVYLWFSSNVNYKGNYCIIISNLNLQACFGWKEMKIHKINRNLHQNRCQRIILSGIERIFNTENLADLGCEVLKSKYPALVRRFKIIILFWKAG